MKTNVFTLFSLLVVAVVAALFPYLANAQSTTSTIGVSVTIEEEEVETPPAGGGGGGGGGSSDEETSIRFRGRASPLSIVTALKDGQTVIDTIAGPDARFDFTLTGVTTGRYNFALYGRDTNGLTTSLFAFPITLTDGATTQISGIFLAPTIEVDKAEVRRGDNITIFGQSNPNSSITINVNSSHEHFVNALTDSEGVYLYNFDSLLLELGQHQTRSRSAFVSEASEFGKTVGFVVGTQNVPKTAGTCIRGDVNCDGRVNLVDFSIAAFWYKRVLSSEVAQRERDVLNADGQVNIIDFSIMAFHWTG